MFRDWLCSAGAVALAVQVWCVPRPAAAQVAAARVQMEEARVVTLAGNVHPLARPEFDLGGLTPETPLGQMVLVLKPAPAQQAALDALVAAQQNPASPLFHRWLTPAQFGARFGAGAKGFAAAEAWLRSRGFRVDEIPAGNRLIVFSGNAGQVSDAFHVEMRRYGVGGVAHIANAQDPQIPAALSGVVEGVLSLHDFRRSGLARAGGAMQTRPQYSAGGTHYLFPADFAAIYDVNPLYAAGVNGAGTAIAVAGRSNIDPADVAAFRAAAGLPANQPTVVLAGADPGLVSGDRMESTLDVEWSGAVAPGAAVKLVAAASSATTDGVDLAAAYAVNHALAPVLSVSYSTCEAEMGAAEMAFYNSLWEQAASEGISVFVAAGDAGAAACSAGADSRGAQAAVNGLCSSPYATCVGGTEFNDSANAGQYWAAANPADYGTALGYIPEEVWNESAADGGTGLWASGGGMSQVYAQPAWQAQVEGGAAANGMRGVPDVALAAASHDGAVVVEGGSFQVIHGTSAATAEFAGLMALVVQAQGGAAQGSANPELYGLAAEGLGGFHSTLSGNNTVPGVEGFTAAGQTYNLATGLGSVDARVLAGDWGGERVAVTGGGDGGPDFTLTLSAPEGGVPAGGVVEIGVGVEESGPAGAVKLSASAPAGVTVSFTPDSAAPGAAATATIRVASTVAPSVQTITIMGSDASGSQSAVFALRVTAMAAACPLRLVRMRCAVPARGLLR